MTLNLDPPTSVSTEVCHHALGDIWAMQPHWICNWPGRNKGALKKHLCWVWLSDYWDNEPQKNENFLKNVTLGEGKKPLPEGKLDTDSHSSNNLSENLRGWNTQQDGMKGQRWWDSSDGHILDPLIKLRSLFRTLKMDFGVPWIFSSYPLKGPH